MAFVRGLLGLPEHEALVPPERLPVLPPPPPTPLTEDKPGLVPPVPDGRAAWVHACTAAPARAAGTGAASADWACDEEREAGSEACANAFTPGAGSGEEGGSGGGAPSRGG
ncbi:MAG: hypothetical protein WDN49_10420 [Acetobacteraceae bacterium]